MRPQPDRRQARAVRHSDVSARGSRGRWPGGYLAEWTYSGAAGQRVVITMDSEDVDAYLVVLRDDGTEIASDDESAGPNPRVEFRAFEARRMHDPCDERFLRGNRSVHDPDGGVTSEQRCTEYCSETRLVAVGGELMHPAWQLTGPCGWWIALAMLAISLFGHAVAAQEDCTIDGDRGHWDDIQRFRRCMDVYVSDDWDPWILHKAARWTGNPTIVQLLLEAGADPRARDDDGLTPLHRGAVNNNPVVTLHLLAAGADPNAPDNEGYTPLHYSAAQGRNGRVVARLLAGGADPLVESNDGRTPLHSALRYAAERSVVSELVEAGAAENLTFLQMAVLEGDSLAVGLLLAEGADPNAADAYGWSSLHFAVPLAGPGVVAALVAAGADPNLRTIGGATALHLAASQAPLPVVSDLLTAGADPNVRDGEVEGVWTPLHYAAQRSRHPSVVLALLDAGANPSIRDASGQRPVDFARENDAITGSSAYGRLLVNQPSPLVAGRSATGNLAATDGVRWGLSYYDEWSYSATVGQRIVVTLESDEVDAYLLVLREDGTEVASDDDGGDGRNARVEFRVPATGRYTILATSAIAEETGRYTIRAERPVPDEGR